MAVGRSKQPDIWSAPWWGNPAKKPAWIKRQEALWREWRRLRTEWTVPACPPEREWIEPQFRDCAPTPLGQDARLHPGLARLSRQLNDPNFDRPVRVQRAAERAARAELGLPAHAGGRPAGRSAVATEVRRRIDTLAESEPAWRTMSFLEVARRTDVRAIIDQGEISERTARNVLSDAKRERGG